MVFWSRKSISEPEIPDITQEEEGGEAEGGEQAQGETNAIPDENAEPKEEALGVSTPTGEEDTPRKGERLVPASINIDRFYPSTKQCSVLTLYHIIPAFNEPVEEAF